MAETSVILPCWIVDDTLLRLTQRCIQSVRDTSDVELIICDNGSTLGQDLLRDEADIYLRDDKNQGYVKAINSGIRVSHGKYIVAGNNDYMMSDGWEQAMIGVLENIPDAGIACPHVRGSPKEESCWLEPGTPGGWWMAKRELFDKIGLLDERFFNVFGDYDLLWRMRKHLNKRVYTTPAVTVDHYGEASLSRFGSRVKEYNRGQWLILDKWKDDPDLLLFVGQVIDISELHGWLKEHSEYGQGTNASFSS